jgi:hypothetical protein
VSELIEETNSKTSISSIKPSLYDKALFQNNSIMKRGKSQNIAIVLIAPDGTEHPISGRLGDAKAIELVSAAAGRWLPVGVVPYQLVRDGKVVAFYDPEAPLREGGLRDGDRLTTAMDNEQPLNEPSFLQFARNIAMARRINKTASTSWGHHVGHVGIA